MVPALLAIYHNLKKFQPIRIFKKMIKFSLLTVLVIFVTIKNSESYLTNTKQDIIHSLNKELNIQHLCIIKDFDFQITHEILYFIKILSWKKIYSSASNISLTITALHEYYKTEEENYSKASEYEYRYLIDKKRANWVYPPKTMYLIKDEKMLSQFFTVSILNLIKIQIDFNVSLFLQV